MLLSGLYGNKVDVEVAVIVLVVAMVVIVFVRVVVVIVMVVIVVAVKHPSSIATSQHWAKVGIQQRVACVTAPSTHGTSRDISRRQRAAFLSLVAAQGQKQ